MSYRELMKKFEGIRSYMRDFYVYGYKVRDEYDEQSARSYDNARRRIENWMGDYYKRTEDGRVNYLSIDSREVQQNPLYKALKTCSFTDKDITMYFLILDILQGAGEGLTVTEIVDEMVDRLTVFDCECLFDETTCRNKLKEYVKLGILHEKKLHNKNHYYRADDFSLLGMTDALAFFSEVAPCGVIGSYLQDRENISLNDSPFLFRQDYFAEALDSEITYRLLSAIHDGVRVGLREKRPNKKTCTSVEVIPLRLAASMQTGRRYLLAFNCKSETFQSHRIDYIEDVHMRGKIENIDELKKKLDERQQHMWGVEIGGQTGKTEHVEFDIYVGSNEQHIIKRLEREKRFGKLTRIDNETWRFSADITNTAEILPWLRTYICRIKRIEMTNTKAKEIFISDVREMKRLYNAEEANEDDIS